LDCNEKNRAVGLFFKFKQSFFQEGSSHAHPNTSVLLTIGFRYKSIGLIDYDANGDNPLRSFQEVVNGLKPFGMNSLTVS
jgi:hypothetical protein